jgi:hypothetical protein
MSKKGFPPEPKNAEIPIITGVPAVVSHGGIPSNTFRIPPEGTARDFRVL